MLRWGYLSVLLMSFIENLELFIEVLGFFIEMFSLRCRNGILNHINVTLKDFIVTLIYLNRWIKYTVGSLNIPKQIYKTLYRFDK